MSERTRVVLINAVLILVVLVFFVVVLEVALRVVNAEGSVRFTRPDNVFGHVFRPGMRHTFATREFRTDVTINSDGFRDDEFIVPKPSGTYRIAVLGDSFCAALQVPLEETFHSLLEKKLSRPGRKVDLLNLGVLAYGNVREWMLYRLLAKKLEVDAVLWFIFPFNDPSDNLDFMTHDYPRPDLPDFEARVAEARARPAGKERKRINLWLDDHSYLYRWQKAMIARLSARWKELTGHTDKGMKDLILFFTDPTSSKSVEGWRVTSDVLDRFARELTDDGVSAIPVVFMPRIAYDGDRLKTFARTAGLPEDIAPSLFAPKVGEISAVLKRAGLRPVDLTPLFAATDAGGEGDVYFEQAQHFTPYGHRLIADTLAVEIERRFLR